MRIYILIVLGSFLFTSCASLLNNKQMIIEVHSKPDSATICLDNDSCFTTPLCLVVPRSYSDFNIVVKNDSVEKTIRIKSKVSPEFKWGNLLFVYFCPIGYVIDASSREKIYSYDQSIYVDFFDKKLFYQKWKSSKKGQFFLRGSIPWINFLEFNRGQGLENFKSYMGLKVGVDYYHSKRSFLSLSVGATGISDIAFPVMDRRFIDTAQFAQSFSAKLTNNHDINIFSTNNISLTLGYGLSLTHFRYRQIFDDSTTNKIIELNKSNKTTLGLCFDANVILFKYGFIGMNLLPSYYTLNSGKWESSYLSYFDIGVRFPIGNYKKDQIKVIKYKPKLIE
ncbi:MAG: hypothetical protein ACEQSR_11890 [Candidatus Methylacidiphilales bacterium]